VAGTCGARRTQPAGTQHAPDLPISWLIYTLIRGEIVEWYPYPFINVNEHGYAVVAAMCVGVAAVMLGLAVGAVWLDGRRARTFVPASPKNLDQAP
jgi:hypothetical protein